MLTNEEKLLKNLADELHKCKRAINGNDLRLSLNHTLLSAEETNTFRE